MSYVTYNLGSINICLELDFAIALQLISQEFQTFHCDATLINAGKLAKMGHRLPLRLRATVDLSIFCFYFH